MKLFYGLFFVLLVIVLDEVLGAARKPPKKKKKKPGIKPVIQLNPGEVAVQEPGWKSVYRLRVGKYWKPIKSPGYPSFQGSQMQASWILEAPIGWRVKIAYKDLSIATRVGQTCSKSYVELIDVKAGKSQGRACGMENPGDYVSMGSLMRIDLMSDNYRGKYRGFLIYALMSREQPGMRTSRTFPAKKPPPSTKGKVTGKVNYHELKALQPQKTQKLPQPNFPKNLRLIYASDAVGDSDVIDDEAEEAPALEADDEYWYDLPYTDNEGQSSESHPGGARISFVPKRKPKPKPADESAEFEYETDVEDGETGEEQDFWSYVNQPANGLPPPVEYHDEDKDDGTFSTLHLIIISASIVTCILIISVVFLIKKCYVDKWDKSKSEKMPDIYDSDRPKNAHKLVELPGLDPSLANPIPHRTYEHELCKYQNLTGDLQPPPYSVRHSSGPPVPFYGATPLMQQMERTRSSMYRRPLPPAPIEEQLPVGGGEVDYCSGDEDQVVTLKREYSTWEIEAKKQKTKSLCED